MWHTHSMKIKFNDTLRVHINIRGRPGNAKGENNKSACSTCAWSRLLSFFRVWRKHTHGNRYVLLLSCCDRRKMITTVDSKSGFSFVEHGFFKPIADEYHIWSSTANVVRAHLPHVIWTVVLANVGTRNTVPRSEACWTKLCVCIPRSNEAQLTMAAQA